MFFLATRQISGNEGSEVTISYTYPSNGITSGFTLEFIANPFVFVSELQTGNTTNSFYTNGTTVVSNGTTSVKLRKNKSEAHRINILVIGVLSQNSLKKFES